MSWLWFFSYFGTGGVLFPRVSNLVPSLDLDFFSLTLDASWLSTRLWSASSVVFSRKPRFQFVCLMTRLEGLSIVMSPAPVGFMDRMFKVCETCSLCTGFSDRLLQMFECCGFWTGFTDRLYKMCGCVGFWTFDMDRVCMMPKYCCFWTSDMRWRSRVLGIGKETVSMLFLLCFTSWSNSWEVKVS